MNLVSSHPSHEALFEAAQKRDAGALAPHIAGCAECRSAFNRLKNGALLLDEGRRAPDLDDIDWSKMDAVLVAEAERVASGIRVGSIRAPRPWRGYAVAGGFAMAAAAGFWFYTHDSRNAVEAPIAHRTQQAPKPAMEPRPASHLVDGTVMLAAGGAAQVQSQGAPVALASGAPVREGARVTTATHGRAVIAVAPSVAVDVRGESEVSFATLREGEVTLALASGEVAIEHEGNRVPVGVQSGRWKVAIDGDAVVRVQTSMLRVVVLGGRASVGADGVTTTHFTGPIVLELPAQGTAATVPGEATDAARLDLALFRVQGDAFRLPAIDPAAVITARGHGVLPARLEMVRSVPVTLEARVGRMLMTLDVGSGRELTWHRVNTPTVASTQAPTPRTTPTAVVAPTPAQQGREMTAREESYVARSIRGRVGPCFTRCAEQNTCPQLRGRAVLAVDAEGHATLQSIDPSANAARACVAMQAPAIRFPATGAPFLYEIPVGR